jgi:hypothetical protein
MAARRKKKRAKRKHPLNEKGSVLKRKIAELPAHHQKAIAEWLDPMRFRREGGR